MLPRWGCLLVLFFLTRGFAILGFGGFDWISCSVTARLQEPPVCVRNRGGFVEKVRGERSGRSES